MSVFDLLAEHAQLDFGQARMLPLAAYRSDEVLAAEVTELFGHDWLCVGRAADIDAAGDRLTADLPRLDGGSRPVIIVRGDDGIVRCFDNICVHRGAQLVEPGTGSDARFVCPYHAWTYRLDGSLIGAPHAGDRVDPTCHRLTELAVELWQGFVFVNQNPDAPPFSGMVAGLTEVVDQYGLADYRTVHTATETWHTNWKLLVENFMDPYHVFHVHRSTFGADGDSVEETEVYPGTDRWTHHRVVERSRPDLAAPDNPLIGDWRKTIVLAAAFPGFVMQVQPDWCWSLQMMPVGTDRVRICSHVAISRHTLDHLGDGAADWVAELLALVERVNGEDRPIVEGVLRGVHAPQFDRAPMAALERNVFDFDRYIAGRLTSHL